MVGRRIVHSLASAFAAALLALPCASFAQTIQSPFNESYSLTTLGAPSGLPSPFGGLFILSSDPNTLYIGGDANHASSGLYAVGLTRSENGQITGFSGSAVRVVDTPYIDGGIQIDPSGCLSYGEWPVNNYAQVNYPGTCRMPPGQATNEIALGTYGIASASASVAFIPGGYPGAGGMRIASYGGGQFYSVSFTRSNSGLISINGASLAATLQGGPEGWAYVPLGSTLFPNPSMIVTEYGAGNVAVYDMDGSGNPTVSSRRVFITGLSGAEGAAIDPRTGAFLFSTFGGLNNVVVVNGFSSLPTATLAPSLTFSSYNVGTTSPAQAVTLTNTSATVSLSISSFTASGDFAVVPAPALDGESKSGASTTCYSTLAPGASCTIAVTFTPTAGGERSGSLTVTSNASGSPHSVSLFGTGVATGAPGVSLTPSSLNFGSVTIGATSSASTVTLTNTGGTSLSITSIGISGDYTKSTSCGSTLAAGASCTMDVRFTPTAAGSRTGSLTVTSNASGSPHSVSLTGTGVAPPAPLVVLTATSLAFGSQAVGTTSDPQTVTAINIGTAAASVSSITPSAGFTATGGCSSIAAGGSCTMQVRFAPTSPGPANGTLTISTNAPGSPLTVTLTGSGTVPTVSLTPSSLNFGNQGLGTTSAAQRVTLTNTGGATLVINSIAPSGRFQVSATTCGATLLPSANCTIDVTFAPILPGGAVTGTLTVTTNATGSPHTVALSGTGTGPAVGLSAATIAFGSQAVGTTSPSQRVTLTNTGTSALTVSGVSATTPFVAVSSCVGSLAGQATCTIEVTFTPTAAGPAAGLLSVSSNAPGSPHTVALSGTGTAPGVSLSPGSLAFGSIAVGTTSSARNVTLTNTGVAPLLITSVSAGGMFGATNNCPSSLAVGGTCTISVTFAPTGVGSFTGSVSVASNAPGSPHTVALSGSATGPAVTLSPTSLAFEAALGATTPSQRVTLTNAGTAPLSVSGLSLQGDFGFVSNCPLSPATLSVGGSCSIDVTFSPLSIGSQTNALLVSSNAPGSPSQVTVSGVGQSPPKPVVGVSPTSLAFSDQQIGTTSAVQSAILTNSSTTTAHFGAITIAGAGYLRTTTPAPGITDLSCGSTLASGARCHVSVVFAPAATGSSNGSITITNDGTAPTLTVQLSGTGIPRQQALVTVTPSLTFGDQIIDTQSAGQTLTITNSGTQTLNVSTVTLGGANASEFSLSGTCTGAIQPNQQCALQVTFKPVTVGAKTASVAINSNAGNTPNATVPLTGNAVPVPTPVVQLGATTLGFGNVIYGSSASMGVSFSNSGTAPLQILGIDETGNTDFSVVQSCGTSLAAGARCNLTVNFAPHAIGARSGTINIRSNAEGSPHHIPLTGTGCRYFSPAAARFFLTSC